MYRPHCVSALFAVVLALPAVQPAAASIYFGTGNQQYDNVNIAADINAMSIVGDIGNTGITMTFENMIGPDGATQVEMHGQHGVAFVESYLDSLAGATPTGFSSITLMPQAGYGFTAGDFKLDQLNSLINPTGFVTFTGVDQFGNPTSDTFSIDQTGQNPYQFWTADGELVLSLVLTVPTTDLLQDIKQVSLNAAPVVPIPAALPLFVTGAGIIGLLARRRKRKSPSTVC